MGIRCRARLENDEQCPEKARTGRLLCGKPGEGYHLSPISGDEPEFDPDRWTQAPTVRRSHNCFSYAMNAMDYRRVEDCAKHGGNTCEVSYHQPGGTLKTNKRLRRESYARCKSLVKLIKQDVPTMRQIKYNQRSPIGYSKIALVIDPMDDYHFYRQDPDGYWSHKPGSQPVTRFDADGVLIIDPKTASRDYTKQGKSLNYTLFCGFFSVPRRMRILLEKGGSGAAAAKRFTRKKRL